MSQNLQEQLLLLPDYLGNHLLISVSALALGIVICLPAAIAVTRIKPLQMPALMFASVMQTIPGIALLALMVPLLGLIGFMPALVALFLYSMLPILRNTVTGITSVEPSMKEAALGLGMTSRQMLWQVELPVALPVIIAGIRTSTVWVIGTATLSTPVGATSLGNYIFSGLQTQNHTAVLVGCISAAALAIVLDSLIRLIEIAVEQRSRLKGVLAAVGILLVFAGGMTTFALEREYLPEQPTVVIGSKPFTEQYILSALLSQELLEAGFNVDTRSSMGSTILFEALKEGQVDCYVDYSGTIWANVMNRSDTKPSGKVLAGMTEWLKKEYGIVCLGALGFENTYALAVKNKLADSLKLRTIADLSAHSPDLSIGSDYEFFSRPEWFAIRDNYNLRLKQTLSMDPALMYSAINEDQIDIVTAYSTDGRIAAYSLYVLDDPLQALPPYDAVILLSAKAASNKSLTGALLPLIGAIDNSIMRRANMKVDIENISVEQAATEIREELKK